MKKLLLALAIMAAPFVARAGFLDVFTPSRMPEKSLGYAGETNAPPKSIFLLGLANNKSQLESLIEDIDDTHAWNDLLIKQVSERENLAYEQASGKASSALNDANDVQKDVVAPIASAVGSLAAGGLGLLLGKNYLSKPGDISLAEHKAKVNEAGSKDPLDFNPLT